MIESFLEWFIGPNWVLMFGTFVPLLALGLLMISAKWLIEKGLE